MTSAIRMWQPRRRDVIWIEFGDRHGREIAAHHPLLVLSPQRFNARTGLVIGLPMTSAECNEDNPFAIKFLTAQGQNSYVLAFQPKSFDWRARHAHLHPMHQVPEPVFVAACRTLNRIIQIH